MRPPAASGTWGPDALRLPGLPAWRPPVEAHRVGVAVAIHIARAAGAEVAILVEAVGVADLDVAGEAARILVVAVVAAAEDRGRAVAVAIDARRLAAVARLVALLSAAARDRRAGAAFAQCAGRARHDTALHAIAEQPVVATIVGGAAVAQRGRQRQPQRSRTGLYELIVIDETLRRLIHEGASEADLLRQARKSTPAMLEDGWNKVIAGITSADEVLRVTRDE